MNQTLRRRIRQENKLKLIAVAITLAILITFLYNIIFSNSSIQGDIDVSNKGYITIEVQHQDTLWTIAQTYMNQDYYTIETFLDEVVIMNHIHNDTIFAGEQLLIPVIP